MAIKATQLYVEVKADTSNAEQGMARVQQQAKGLGGSLGGIGKIAAGAFAAIGGVALAKAAFNGAKRAVIDFNASMEQSAIAWSTMLGSQQAANRMLADLQQFAKETPFDFPELEEGSRRLLAMGFNAKDVIPMMTTLGDTAAALGLGTEGVNRLGLAIGQMRAKTKVSGEEMRQLTEAGVPAWEILARAVGKPIPEVMKLASEGKIASSVFIQAFQTFSQQNYGGMMQRQSQTFRGAMSNIKDSLTQGAATAFQPLFAKLSEGAVRFAEFLNTERFEAFVSKVRALVSGAIAGAERLSSRWRAYLGEMHETTTAVSAGAQRALQTLVGWFAEQLPKLREIVETVLGGVRRFWQEHGERITAIATSIWEFIQRHVQRILGGIGEGINLALALIKGDWEGAWTSYKTILVTVWNGIVDYLATSAKYVISIIGGVYQALGKDDPTVGWAARIDDWANSMQRAASEALGVEQTVGQAAGTAKTWADYAARGAEVTEGWALAWKNLGKEASQGMGGLRAAEAAAAAGAQMAAAGFDLMGGSADMAQRNVGDLVAALVRMHPAAMAAAQTVAHWEAQIAGVNGALQANQRAQKGAQDSLTRSQQKLARLNDSLSEAQRRLQELASPRLTGMGRIDMQIGALQDHLKRIELADVLGKPLAEIVRQYPLLTAGAEAFISTLQPGEKGLREQLQALELMRSLQYDERVRLLGAQASPLSGEMTYEAARQAIMDTQDEITGLTGAIVLQEAKVARQERALARLRKEAEGLNEALQGYQANLAAAQAAQALVNEGLELAYTWFVQDRQAMIELGGEAATQVALMDAKARELLGGVSGFASDTTTIASETLAGMIATFQSSSAQAVIEVNKNLDLIPRDIYTYHHIVRVYEGGASGPAPSAAAVEGRARGGPVYAGRPYVVGEEGPELFVPRLTGTIAPATRGSSSAAAAGGIVIERLVVEGTVISEKELAAAVYEELQRLRRRNGAAGLA